MLILPSHGVEPSCRFQINVQHSMAWNSLFKCIKIQRMHVFWREDKPDYLLRVNLFVLKLWFLHNLKNCDKPFATHWLFTHAFHLLFCVCEIQTMTIVFSRISYLIKQGNNFIDNHSTAFIDLSCDQTFLATWKPSLKSNETFCY